MADDKTPENQPDPFAGLPLFGDLSKALAGQGPLNWDAARQFAQVGATGGAPEANVDPAVRLAFEEFARIVRPHVADVVGSSREPGDVRTVTRSQWAAETLEAYRHLFTELATALGNAPTPSDDELATDPMLSMMAGLSRMMAPAMLGMSVGSMVGRLATRAFGTHDLPIPRAARAGHTRSEQHRRVRRAVGDPAATRCGCGCWPTSCRRDVVAGRTPARGAVRSRAPPRRADSDPIPTRSQSG